MTSASRDDIVQQLMRLRRQYNVSEQDITRSVSIIDRYFSRRKDFDILVVNKKIVVLAKKTPASTPDAI